ncbi:MAG: hypothetical protein LDL41_05965 [Coleofasciculus sp. S288]|nr:hypothetical protein [Coleofasciculus sp. S288]
MSSCELPYPSGNSPLAPEDLAFGEGGTGIALLATHWSAYTYRIYPRYR